MCSSDLFPAGSTVTVDADPVGGTLVFTSAAGETLVADAGARRDARSAGGSTAGPSPERSRIDELLAVPSIRKDEGGDRLN